jgi:hypothetical protein
MKPTVCYLDLDGVLVNFVAGALRLHGKELPPRDVCWNFPDLIGFAGDRAADFWSPLGFDFWAGLDWTPEGRATLAAIEDAFGGSVVVMTSPCNTPGAVEGKVAWIRRELPAYRRRFFVGPAKHYAAGPGKLLIDDSDDNAELFAGAGGRVLLVPRPWNRRAAETDDLGRFNPATLAEEILAISTE